MIELKKYYVTAYKDNKEVKSRYDKAYSKNHAKVRFEVTLEVKHPDIEFDEIKVQEIK